MCSTRSGSPAASLLTRFCRSDARWWPFKEIPGAVCKSWEKKEVCLQEGFFRDSDQHEGDRLRRLHGTPKTLPVGTKFYVFTDPHVEFKQVVEVRKVSMLCPMVISKCDFCLLDGLLKCRHLIMMPWSGPAQLAPQKATPGIRTRYLHRAR